LLIPTPEDFCIPEAEKDIVPPLNPSELSSLDTGRKMSAVFDLSNQNERSRETGIIDPAAHTVTVTLKPSDY